MKTCHWKSLAGLAFAGLFLISGPAPLFADEDQDMINEANKELGKANDATKEAQNNTPQESVRRPENDLDKAAKNNDDVQADPKSTQQQKDDAQKAEDTARAKADDAVKDYHDPGKAETYRKALEKRREARKNLKKLLPKLNKLLQKRRTHLDPSTYRDLEKIVKDIGLLNGPLSAAWETTAMNSFHGLVAQGMIAATLTSTGETIGIVANLKIHNNTSKPLSVTIPATVLASQDGKCQSYAVPKPTTVAVAPNKDKVVPIDGVCTQPHRPPAENGSTGQIALVDPQTPEFQKTYGPQLACTQDVIRTATELQKEGKFHTPFSSDPKKELQSVVQQTVWAANPTHDGTDTTKVDLTHTIYKQVNPKTEEQKKALQPGIDSIWGAVQLTGKTAKVIVEPGQTPGYELTGAVAKPENISNDTPTSTVEKLAPEEKPTPPQTTEKPKLPQPNPHKDEPSVFDGPMQEGAEAARAIPTQTRDAKKALDDAKKAQRDAKKKAVDSDPKVKQLRDEIAKQTKLKNDPRADDAIKDKYQEKINKAQEDLNKAKADAEKNWNDSQEKKDTQKAVDDAQKDVNDLEKNKPPLPPDADKMTQPDGQGKVDEKDMGKEGGSSVMPSGVGR